MIFNTRVGSLIVFLKADNAKLQKKTSKKLEKQQVPQRSEGQKKVALFAHLHQYERNLSITKDIR